MSPKAEKLPSGSYRMRVVDADGKRRSKTFKLKGDADGWAAQAVIARQTGVPLVQSKVTLEAIYQNWQNVHGRYLEPGTLRDYESVIDKHLIPRLGHADVTKLKRASVLEMMAALDEAGVSRDRQRRVLKMLRMLLNFAIEQDQLTVNVAANVKMPKKPQAEPIIPFSVAQAEHHRAHLRAQGQYQDAILFSLMNYGGLRPKEAAALRWEDVLERTIVVQATKTNRRRSVELLEPLREDLVELSLALGRPSGLIYPPARADQWSKAIQRDWTRDVFHPTMQATGCDRHGAKRPTPYLLRHSYASMLIQAGHPVTYVALQMGHVTPDQTTKTYSHFIADAPTILHVEPSEAVLAAIVTARREKPWSQNGHGAISKPGLKVAQSRS